MRKNFGRFVGMIFFSFLFVFSVITGTAFADVQADTCMTCHEPATGDDLLGDDTLEIQSSWIASSPSVSRNDVSVVSVLLSGKSSRFIQPYFVADIPGQPYPYHPFDYVEEPANPVTDYDGMRLDPRLINNIKLE